ncbi:hypothetical protein GCM10010512_12740 [Streptomyces thermoviolaceus subsp. thermoviolaceus]|nr:hypothetical protein GCM10010512_12740 [Streptomyces thermoviolaceus subsp. thermoviolaceus]
MRGTGGSLGMRYMAGPGGSRPGNRAGPRLMQKTTEDPWRESRLAPNGFEPTGTPEHAGRAHGRPAFNCLTRQGDDGREGRDRGKRSCRSGQRRDAVLPVGPAEGCGPAGRDSGGRRRGGRPEQAGSRGRSRAGRLSGAHGFAALRILWVSCERTGFRFLPVPVSGVPEK